MIGEIEFDQVSFTYPGRLETPVTIIIPSLSTFVLSSFLDSQQLVSEDSFRENRRPRRSIGMWK